MTTFSQYGWRALAPPATLWNALRAVRIARGQAQMAGGFDDDGVQAGISTSPTGNAIFMWANSRLATYVVDTDTWHGPIVLPPNFKPSGFADLYRNQRTMTFDTTTQTFWTVDITGNSINKVWPSIPSNARFDFSLLPGPGGYKGLGWTLGVVAFFATSRDGVCAVAVNDLFAHSLLIFFDYGGNAGGLGASIILGVLPVNEQLVSFNGRMNGAVPGAGIASGNQELPFRLYRSFAGALQPQYRSLFNFVPDIVWNLMRTQFSVPFRIDDGAATPGSVFEGMCTQGPPLGPLYDTQDTNFERTLNAIAGNAGAVRCMGGAFNGSIVEGNPGALGSVLRQVLNIPYNLYGGAFGLPLTADVPVGFSANPAWCVFAIRGTAAIMDDNNQFWLLIMVITNTNVFLTRNWAKGALLK